MATENKLLIIVDAYGPARHFSHYLKKQGYFCAHLLGTPLALPRLKLFDMNNYDAHLVHKGNIDETIANIYALTKKLDARLLEIIPGVEPGVLLADRLSHHFKLQTNGIEKSIARRNKFAMAEALAAKGIAIPAYCQTNQLSDVVAFAHRHLWPIVLKPLDSAGTNGVHFCHSEKELEQAFNSIIGAKNNMGSINEAVLVQTFLPGKEYMVNTVSHQCKHYVTDIWWADKIKIAGYAQIYNKNHLLTSDTEEYLLLRDYVFRVLDALDIKYGPAHAEVIITPDGPRLVEIASRISGLVDPEFNQACFGNNQIELTLESYLQPEKFLNRMDQPYLIKKHGLQIILAAKKSGKILATDFSEQLSCVKNLISFSLKFATGDTLLKTYDLSTAVGIVNLAAENKEELLNGYRQVQYLFEKHIEIE